MSDAIGKSWLDDAFSYAIIQWRALCYYPDDELAEPDCNAAERKLRAVGIEKIQQGS